MRAWVGVSVFPFLSHTFEITILLENQTFFTRIDRLTEYM